MGITFRHDAAGVVPPSNNTTRKYGQQLVLQQNQQKYAAQQAGYDRLFQLGRDAQQAQNQFAQDVRQQTFLQRRDQAQNDFQTARDKALFDQQQQVQAAQRRQAFMDEARKQSTGIIMQDINNGEYDPVTAKRLQQNIVAESEALGSDQYDATQRAEALAKIRAERALLSTNKLQKPPAPSPQEQFDKSIVTGPDGSQYRQNAKGDFEPLPQQPKRPSSAAEAFAADPKLRDKYFADAKELKQAPDENGLKPAWTPEKRQEAIELAHKLWEQDNLPTPAPDGQVSPPSPGEMKSILEDTAQRPEQGLPPTPVSDRAQLPDPGMPPSPASPAGGQQTAPLTPEEYHAQMTEQGYQLITPGNGRRPYYYKDTTVGQQPPESPASAPIPLTANASSQSPAGMPTAAPSNPWTEVASPESAAAPTPAAQTQPAALVAPDFGALASSAKSSADKNFIGKMQEVYQGKPPEVQAAISVLLNPSSSDQDAARAMIYLQQNGIDVAKLAKPRTATDDLNEYQKNLTTTMR